MQSVAIIMPVHNKLDYTRNCMKSLERLTSGKNFENIHILTVIIDDGSTDGTAEWLSKNYPETIVLKGDGNLWWSGGVNAGARFIVQEEKADYLLLWNNDIEAADDYFEKLDELIPLLDNKTIVGSKIYCKEPPDMIWSFGGIFNPVNGKKYMIGYEEMEDSKYNSPGEADWLPGMGTLVPADIVRKIGYWDEKDFPQYHGDSDFTFRAKKKAYRILVYPQLRLWNDNENTGLEYKEKLKDLFNLMNNTRSQHNFRKNILFYKRHSSSILAYWPLFVSYFYLFGGFFKWRILSLFGIERKK